MEKNKLLNIFSLHGIYFQNDENRLTANFLFLLSENRQTFLVSFLKEIGFSFDKKELAEAEITFQGHLIEDGQAFIPDAEIKIGDQLHIIIEAKIGTNHIYNEQIQLYSSYLAKSSSKNKQLICITQINESKLFNEIIINCELSKDSFCYFQWHQIIDILKKSIDLNTEVVRLNEKRIILGKRTDYSQRTVALFIDELEDTMYDKKIIDDIKIGAIPDITITTQDYWYMKTALKYNVWFPSGAAEYGLAPSKYVAYYETIDEGRNKNPTTITYIARNRIYWNRITLSDAKQIYELQNLFRDKSIAEEISTWCKDGDTFHVVLTEKPIRLSKPLHLRLTNKARILSKRKCAFSEFMSAKSIDDIL